MDKTERDMEILRRVGLGQSERDIARALGISRSTVWGVKQARKAQRAEEPA